MAQTAKNTKPVFYAAAVFIAVGALPLPYGYYQLLRLVAFIVFGWAALIAYEQKTYFWPYVLGFGALLFNPLFKITMPKEFWMLADPAAGGLLAYWAWMRMKD